jgi:hypothetical protein
MVDNAFIGTAPSTSTGELLTSASVDNDGESLVSIAALLSLSATLTTVRPVPSVGRELEEEAVEA